MAKLDAFTCRRITKFVNDHRVSTGQLPTLKDLANGGFDHDIVAAAVKNKTLDTLYVTLTNGTIVKGFKVHQ